MNDQEENTDLPEETTVTESSEIPEAAEIVSPEGDEKKDKKPKKEKKSKKGKKKIHNKGNHFMDILQSCFSEFLPIIIASFGVLVIVIFSCLACYDNQDEHEKKRKIINR